MRQYRKCFLLLILLLVLCGCQNAAEQEWIFDLPEANPVLEAQPEPVSYPMTDVSESISILLPGDGELCTLLSQAEEYIGIPAEYQFVPWGELSAQFTAMAESGDFTDLFYGHQMIGIYTYLDYGDEIALDMTEMISRCAPNYLAAIRDNEILSQVAFDGEYGEMYAFFQIADGDGLPDYGPFLRGDWLEELGMDVPQTYADYHDVLVAFRDQYGCSEAFALQPTGAMPGDWLAAGYGVTAYTSGSDMASVGFYVEDGQVKYGPAQQGFYDYLQMLCQWYEEDLFSSEFVTWSDTTAYEKMVINGETGLFYSSLERGSALEKNIQGGGTLVTIPDALKSVGDTSHLGDRSNTSTVGQSLSVFAGSEKAELCVRWCDFWYGDLGVQLWNYGTAEEILPEEIDPAARCMLLPGIADQSLNYAALSEPMKQKIDTWDQGRDNIGRLPSDMKLSEKDQQRFSILAQGLTTAVTVYSTKVIVGEESLEHWDAYLKQLDEYGLQKCLDCLNAYLMN